MADLETAAADVLAAIHELEARITDANARLNQLREGSLHAIEEQCESVWGRLEQEVTTFAQKVAEKKGVLHEFGRDTLGTLAGAHEALSQGYQAAEGHIGEAKDIISRLRDSIEGEEPEVTAMLEGLQAAAYSLEQQLATADTELQEATQAARNFIGTEVPEELQRMEEEVRERAESLRLALQQECQAPIEAKQIDWESKLAEVMTTVEEAFVGTAHHAEEVATFSLEKCTDAFEETFKELTAAAATIQQALEDFGQAADEAAKESLGAAKELDSQVLDTIDALGAASSTITDILTALARYTWTVP